MTFPRALPCSKTCCCSSGAYAYCWVSPPTIAEYCCGLLVAVAWPNCSKSSSQCTPQLRSVSVVDRPIPLISCGRKGFNYVCCDLCDFVCWVPVVTVVRPRVG